MIQWAAWPLAYSKWSDARFDSPGALLPWRELDRGGRGTDECGFYVQAAFRLRIGARLRNLGCQNDRLYDGCCRPGCRMRNHANRAMGCRRWTCSERMYVENLHRGECGKRKDGQIRCRLPQRPRRGMSFAVHVAIWSATPRSIGCSRWSPETKYLIPTTWRKEYTGNRRNTIPPMGIGFLEVFGG